MLTNSREDVLTMAQIGDKKQGLLRTLDWWTILIYVALLTFGWLSVCGACYSFDEPNIFSLSTPSGMQIVWIGTSLCLGLVLLLLDDHLYEMLAYIIFGLLLLLLIATIFNPHEIKGSRSWLVLGPLRLQPAEFAKFATALALAKFMGTFGYNISRVKDFCITLAIVMLPMLCIVLQKETGSALVYLALFVVLYREGMPGGVLFAGIAAVVYFVVGIKFADVLLWATPTSVGEFSVLLLVQLFSAVMVTVYCKSRNDGLLVAFVSVGVTLLALLFSKFVIPFDIVWIQITICASLFAYLIWLGFGKRIQSYYLIATFVIGSVGFFYSADYVLNNVLGDHQRNRINVLLDINVDKDVEAKAGYNVRQSQIAIGSGGLLGKGFLNGTQTKLKYVPEQHTDFIFCTVGEEEGFLGSASVLLLFLFLILRLIRLAERQPTVFGRVYGYSVLSIFLFHIFINVGMVLGLMPVIGIPLPFFSYGGSSLWGFTILLFIFLRIDAGRNKVHN